jgi:hypothetical protein
LRLLDPGYAIQLRRLLLEGVSPGVDQKRDLSGAENTCQVETGAVPQESVEDGYVWQSTASQILESVGTGGERASYLEIQLPQCVFEAVGDQAFILDDHGERLGRTLVALFQRH